MSLNVSTSRDSIKCAKASSSDGRDISMARYARIFGWAIMIIAYACLVPGLILPLYYFTVQGFTNYKTMWGTIQYVNELGGAFPAVLLAFFGIAVPIIKLILIGIAHFRNIPLASKMVVWVSKWAIVDALVACFIMAYFSNAMDGAVISQVDVGFGCFVTYCVLSTAGALILDDCDVEFSTIYASRRYFKLQSWIETRLTSLMAISVCGMLTIASLLVPTVSIGLTGDLVSMSVLSACYRLAFEIYPDFGPCFLIMLFVVLIPLLELIVLSILTARPTNTFASRCALRCLPQCGLLDVYTVSVIVMYIFLNPLGMVSVVIPALGYSILWVTLLVTLATRFVVERRMSMLFSLPVDHLKMPQVERAASGGDSTISSGNTVTVV